MKLRIARLFDCVPERIVRKVQFTDGCWLWMAAKHPHGYGHTWFAGRLWPAHRLFYHWFIGPVPVGLELDHLCREPACVRPDHLEPVTHRENLLRGNGFSGRNGLSAMKARQTHCSRGHPFSGLNLGYQGKGKWRQCKMCQRLAMRRYEAKQRQLCGPGGRLRKAGA